MKYLKYILSMGIILLPLFYWEVPKVWAYLVFINLFVLYVLYLAFNKNLYLSFKKSKLKFALILFLITSLIASIFGFDITKSILGNYYRFDGLVVLFQLAGFSIVLASVYKIKWNKILSFSIFLSAVISSVWNNFGQINFLVGFVLTALPFGIYLFKIEKNKYLKFVILIGFLFLLRVPIIASSYVGLLGVVLILPVWLILNNKKYFKFLILPIICVFFIFIYIWLNNINKHVAYVAENRVRIYRNVFVGTLKKPTFGYGWSNTDYAFQSVVWPMKFNNDVYVDKAHMLFLDVFANTGIIGLIVYLMILFLIIKKLYLQNNTWSNILILSIFITSTLCKYKRNFNIRRVYFLDCSRYDIGVNLGEKRGKFTQI